MFESEGSIDAQKGQAQDIVRIAREQLADKLRELRIPFHESEQGITIDLDSPRAARDRTFAELYTPVQVTKAFRETGKSDFFADMLGMGKIPGGVDFEDDRRRRTVVKVGNDVLGNYCKLDAKISMLFAHVEALLDDRERTRILAENEERYTREYYGEYVEGSRDND